MTLLHLRFAYGNQAARSGIDDVVDKNIVSHVPLHLEFPGTGCRRIVFVERVIDHRAVIGVSPLRRITSDGNSRGMAVIDKIVSRSDVAGGAALVLTGQLDSEVVIMHDVLLDQNSGAAIHVNAIGVFFVLVCRIPARMDVVNQIAAYNSVARLVDRGIGRRMLKTYNVDSDV